MEKVLLNVCPKCLVFHPPVFQKQDIISKQIEISIPNFAQCFKLLVCSIGLLQIEFIKSC